MSDFTKPKSTRTAKKIIAILIGILMIIIPIGIFIYLTLPEDSPIQQTNISTIIPQEAEIITQPVWAGLGAYLIFDPHTHTEYSDGTISQTELANMAAGQCDVLAFTDHSDIQGVSSPSRFDEIDAIRTTHPNMILFSALEINIPSYNGREHLTLITHPNLERRSLAALRAFAEKENDDSEDKDITRAFDEPFFEAVNNYNQIGASTLVIYNHPSRMDTNAIENKNDFIAWSRWSPHLIGFEGGPGHQNVEPHGLYEEALKTVNRWDHIAGNVGDVWDQLLGDGYQLWGAIASSDFHDLEFDYAPCTFSRTHVQVRERSHEAVLEALRAGTFWADHGRILNRLNFNANVAGINEPLYPGGVAQLGEDKQITLNVDVQRGAGSFGKPLNVDFISNCANGRATVIGSATLTENEYNTTLDLTARATGTDRDSCYVRTVVTQDDGIDPKVAMTNHIRFIL